MASNRMGADTRLPLYQQLRDDMLARIAAGEWLPGRSIPTEAELTRHYGVAIGTVRKALETLVAEGLLQRSQGRGTFVRRPNFDASFFRFFRQVGSDGGQVVPHSRVLSTQVEAPSAQVSQALQLAEGEQVLRLQRLRELAGGALICESIWLPASRFAALQALPAEDYANLLYPFYEARCGQAVASAREMLRIEAADGELAQTLGIAVGDPVVVIERTAFGYDRTPLEYRLSRGAAASFRYQIDIS